MKTRRCKHIRDIETKYPYNENEPKEVKSYRLHKANMAVALLKSYENTFYYKYNLKQKRGQIKFV